MNNTKYKITKFNNRFKSREFDTYEVTWEILHKAITRPKPMIEKNKQMLWSPTSFKTRRCIEESEYVSCMVFDVDEDAPKFADVSAWMHANKWQPRKGEVSIDIATQRTSICICMVLLLQSDEKVFSGYIFRCD